MFLEKLESRGLAHFSYILGDLGEAAVIDPRRDCQAYIDIARHNNCQVTHIFETHRNEDFASGSRELAHFTGANIFHGGALDFAFGNPVYEGDIFDIGSFRLQVLETPGHTIESISLVLSDTSASGKPLGVFTGDALFVGDVGRTDLLGQPQQAANLLYDSLFNKILPLGDQAILYPAHGQGSICGRSISDRGFSTIGFERLTNKALQLKDRSDFIDFKIHEEHYSPPSFAHMEQINLNGPEILNFRSPPKPYKPDELEIAVQNGVRILDLRSPEAFAAAHIPGSIFLPLERLSAFAGYFISYDDYIALVLDSTSDLQNAITSLVQLDYTNVIAYIAGGMHAWELSGKSFSTIPLVYAGTLKERMLENARFSILDVRTKAEFERVHLPESTNIYVGHIPQMIDDLPQERPILTFCSSGLRAMIAASLLRASGIEEVQTCMGSMAACTEVGCPIVTSRDPKLVRR